ncbi:hypothetical protein BJX99DRAFT_245478 [Aspergillus californicus]
MAGSAILTLPTARWSPRALLIGLRVWGCISGLPGGFSFGYDQGVISIINVMDQFHTAFPQTETAFGTGFMTGMLLLGAFVGSLTVVVVIFDIGAIFQTAAQDYGMLVAGRAIGGIGVGTLAMISLPNLRGTLLVLESVSIVSGVVIAYWITFGTRFLEGDIAFRLPLGLQMGILAEIVFQRLAKERSCPGVKGWKLEACSWLDLSPVSTLFRSLGQSDEMSLVLSGVFNVLQLVGFFIYAGWACVAFAFLFILIFGVSYSPLGWALPSEVFTTASRSKGVALSTCVTWLANFIIGVATPPMLDTQGYQTYTKGKTLEDMDKHFGGAQGLAERESMRAAVDSVRQNTVTEELGA